MGAYVSPERVERDGILVAFKGESMTEAEAKRRGLLEGKAEKAEVLEVGEPEVTEEPEKKPVKRRTTRKKTEE